MSTGLLSELAPQLADRFETNGLEVERVVRRAPSGALLEVRRQSDGRRLALELLHPTVRDPAAFADRVEREAEAAATIEHPGVVRLLEHGATPDGRIHLLRETVDGVELTRLVEAHERDGVGKAAGPAPTPALVAWLARGVLGALGALHEAGLVVRELSPAALRLARGTDGLVRPVLVELGVGRGWTDEVTLNAPGVVLGSLRYAAPESFDEARTVGPAADLYALGIVLYELATGRYPIVGDQPTSLIAGHLFRPIRPWDETDPDQRVPTGLRQLIARALTKDPAQRFATAAEMRAALDQADDGRADEAEVRSQVAAWLGLAPPTQRAAAPPSARERIEDALERGELTAARRWIEAARRDADQGDDESPAPWLHELGARLIEVERFAHRKEIRRRLDDARALLADGRPSEALASLGDALRLAPEDRELCALRDQIRDEARRAVPADDDEVTASVPRPPAEALSVDVETLLDRARTLARREAFDEAYDAAHRALELDPERGDAAALLASLEACLRIRREAVEQEQDLERTVQGIRQLLDTGQDDAARVALDTATGRFGARSDLIDLQLEAATQRLDETATGLSTVRVDADELPSRETLRQIAERPAPPPAPPPSTASVAEPSPGTGDLGSLTLPMDRVEEAKQRAARQGVVASPPPAPASPPPASPPPASPPPASPAPDAPRPDEVSLSELGFGFEDDDGTDLTLVPPPSARSATPDTGRGGSWIAIGVALLLVFALSYVLSGLVGDGTIERPEWLGGPPSIEDVEPASGGSDPAGEGSDVAPTGPPGDLVLDAAPWAEVAELLDAAGDEVPIAGARSTPLRLSLPPGRYSARLEHPPSGASETVVIEVPSAERVVVRAELDPLTVEEYFDRAGW